MEKYLLIAMGCLIITGCTRESMTSTNREATVKTEQEWREQLTGEQFRVTRQKGTERPFSGAFWDHKDLGIYSCVCCGQDLFVSDTKFDAGCGWPSYFKPINDTCITEKRDVGAGMIRTEVICSQCDAHLGHVFADGPPPTGLRYCINSAAMTFRKK